MTDKKHSELTSCMMSVVGMITATTGMGVMIYYNNMFVGIAIFALGAIVYLDADAPAVRNAERCGK